MKIRKILLTLIAIVAMFTSCVKFDDTFEHKIPTNIKGEYAILFGNNSVKTKASVTSTSGTGYDTFNLFAWNSTNDTIMKPYVVEANGIASYTYEGIGTQELQYFKNYSEWYDFIGVIPTNHSMNLSNGELNVTGVKSFIVNDERAKQAVNLTDTLYWNTGLAVDSPEEFLWSYKRVNKSDYGTTVELPFNHQNALIFLGFSSNKSDTELIDYVPGSPDIPAVPEVRDTTDMWFTLKRSSGNADGSATKTRVKTGDTWGDYVDDYELPAALVAEIKSYYSMDGGTAGDYDLHMNNTTWPSNKQLRIVKVIPDAYKINFQSPDGTITTFFDGFKYLKENGYDIQPRNSGGKPSVWDYVLLDAFVNGTSYTIVGFNATASLSNPNYTVNVTPGTPAVPGRAAIEGIRVFSADSLGVNNLPTDTLYCVHIPHTTIADATISSNGCVLSNRTTSDEVITFSLPSTTTLNSTPVWSPSTFYALPGDTDFNFIVVKLSFTYNGVTSYDVRVPIHLPDGGLVPGKYYKYELYITSTGNGTNDPNEASDEKDEILIEYNPVIKVKLIDTGYTQGDERTFTI